MSGLLAGQFFRASAPVIHERQSSLPNNHKALLRFRTESVSNLTGIGFEKVEVRKMISFKGVHFNESNIFFDNLYSQKVIGQVIGRSTLNLKPSSRYIAPESFIARASTGLEIAYNSGLTLTDNEPIISTIPVNILAEILGYKSLITPLETRGIWTIKLKIKSKKCKVYQTVYYPSLEESLYRLSITGDQVIAEFCSKINKYEDTEKLFSLLRKDFGISIGLEDMNSSKFSYQEYGKLIPCPDNTVRDFIVWATRNHNIYSLGRWGTHRQILMDDVVNDLRIIQKLIETNGYGR